MMNGGYSEVYGPFTTAQMVEWHEMGCFVSNPLIRRVEKKETTTSTSDFDAAFEEDDANVTSSSSHGLQPTILTTLKIVMFSPNRPHINKLSASSPS